jgi:hypothetical protein
LAAVEELRHASPRLRQFQHHITRHGVRDAEIRPSTSNPSCHRLCDFHVHQSDPVTDGLSKGRVVYPQNAVSGRQLPLAVSEHLGVALLSENEPANRPLLGVRCLIGLRRPGFTERPLCRPRVILPPEYPARHELVRVVRKIVFTEAL